MSGENPQATAVRQLRKLHAEMRPLMLLAGLPPEILDLPIQNLENTSLDSVTEELDFLSGVSGRGLRGVSGLQGAEAGSLLGESRRRLREHNLPEQKILRDTTRRSGGRGRNGTSFSKEPNDGKNPGFRLKTEILKFLRELRLRSRETSGRCRRSRLSASRTTARPGDGADRGGADWPGSPMPRTTINAS
jgi:hypothetical protein